MPKYNFKVAIPWYVLKKHLEFQLESVRSQLESSGGEQTPRLQGKAQVLGELIHLPEALELAQEQDLADERENV